MQTLNIAGYKFVSLHDLNQLQADLLAKCTSLTLKGTILLSHEGINISLAGSTDLIPVFLDQLRQDPRFIDMSFHETYSTSQPFQYLKVKIKSEIITLRQPDANPLTCRAAAITPENFKLWLDEKRDFTILDTRNDYEVRFGTFKNAINLHLADFGELPTSLNSIPRDKPVVMFCTGGIRCEKAALYMQVLGFTEVYQLDGGILGYFKKIGGAHYEGECFVFDGRISVDSDLHPTGTVQCLKCQGPVTEVEQQLPTYLIDKACASCGHSH